MKKKLIVIFVSVFLLLAAIAGGGIFAGYKITNSPKILPNVYVGEIAIGKLTQDEAKAELVSNGWRKRCQTDLAVTVFGNVKIDGIDPVKSGMTLSIGEALDEAYSYGHNGNIVENLITYIKAVFEPIDVNALNAKLDEEYIDSFVEKADVAVKAYMGEDEYVLDTVSKTLKMKKGWGKIKLDIAALKTDIAAALAAGESELEFNKYTGELVSPDFSKLHAELEREPVDAKYTDDGKFEVIDEVIGCRFKISDAQTIWDKATVGEELRIPMEITWPEVTGDELRDKLYHDLLGACTTKFPNSGENRRSNLNLASSKLNGMILYPGDVISMNEILGERTEEAGYLPAPAYVDGDVKDELGGGVCQISSTLYAATAFAFLETVERECHYFPVNYMQMGTDATITIPSEGGRSIDFKFKNNKNYPIKIVAKFDNEGSTITFEIWGTLEDGDYMPVKFDNSYTWQFDYMRDVEAPYKDRPGYTIKLTHETYTFEDETGTGYRTLTHRLVLDSEGKTVLDEIINPTRGNGNYAMDTYYQH